MTARGRIVASFVLSSLATIVVLLVLLLVDEPFSSVTFSTHHHHDDHNGISFAATDDGSSETGRRYHRDDDVVVVVPWSSLDDDHNDHVPRDLSFSSFEDPDVRDGGRARLDPRTGAPIALYEPRYLSSSSASAEDAADEFVDRLWNRDDDGTSRSSSPSSSLVCRLVRDRSRRVGPGATTVRYAQRCAVDVDVDVDGTTETEWLPVHEAGLAVTVRDAYHRSDGEDDQSRRISFVADDARRRVASSSSARRRRFALSEDDALRVAAETTGDAEFSLLDATRALFVDDDGNARPVWRARAVPRNDPSRAEELLLDGVDGAALRRRYVASDKRGTLKRRDRPPLRRRRSLRGRSRTPWVLPRENDGTRRRDVEGVVRVDVPALVFDPNPLATAGASYGDEGYGDDGDRASPALRREHVPVVLRGLSRDADGVVRLEGPNAEVVDVDEPFSGVFEGRDDDDDDGTTTDFQRYRHEPGFEAVNAWYHVDAYMRYVRDDLGLDVRPDQYEGGVRFDPHGVGGSDNSYYNPYGQFLVFGDGGVDDAEDSDVVVHELGHGLHDWMVGAISQQQGLSEGFGDYVAVSHSRSKGYWNDTDPQYYWTFPWDGHNEFWEGRAADRLDDRYPDNLVGAAHKDGELWSTCNMRVWDEIGREASDRIHIVGISYTGRRSNQNDAANAVVSAATNLGYGPDVVDAVTRIYEECGYALGVAGGHLLGGAVHNDGGGSGVDHDDVDDCRRQRTTATWLWRTTSTILERFGRTTTTEDEDDRT